jgi:uncharacterized DUF497 family protein
MKIRGLIWLEEVVEKIETKHGVYKEEVQDVISRRPKIKKMRSGHFNNEHVYRALGQTETGRHLTVFFIHKATQEALILSARNMDEKERKSYAQK